MTTIPGRTSTPARQQSRPAAVRSLAASSYGPNLAAHVAAKFERRDRQARARYDRAVLRGSRA